MALKVSKRSDISSFIVMDVMRQANELEAQGQAIYHMEVGQPGTPAPKSALDAVSREMANDKLGYTLALGREDLRVSISNMYAERYGKQIPASRIVITTGSSSGFILSFLAAFDVGDKVALASPGYPAYRNILKALGIQVVDILADLEDGFQPTPEKLDEAITKHGKLDGLIIASPSNPCGSMLGESQFDALTAYCQQNSIRMISDEIYHGVGFGKKEFTAANNPDAIVVNSFSKYYSMTGWRIGWLVVPEDLLRPMECLAQNLFICPPHVSQVAALGALSAAPELDQHIQVYSKNRGLVLGALAKAGIEKIAPADGAFYAYANFGDYTLDSLTFCQKMLVETGIAATPGLDFDPTRGHEYIRFSYCGDTSTIETACDKLADWLLAQPRLKDEK